MKSREDGKPRPVTGSGEIKNCLRRLLKAPRRRLVSADDLIPLALLAFFLFLLPPMEGLASALLALLGVVVVLRIWLGCRGGGGR